MANTHGVRIPFESDTCAPEWERNSYLHLSLTKDLTERLRRELRDVFTVTYEHLSQVQSSWCLAARKKFCCSRSSASTSRTRRAIRRRHLRPAPRPTSLVPARGVRLAIVLARRRRLQRRLRRRRRLRRLRQLLRRYITLICAHVRVAHMFL